MVSASQLGEGGVGGGGGCEYQSKFRGKGDFCINLAF